MPITFKNLKDYEFAYHSSVPTWKSENKVKKKFNLHLFQLYCLYRNTVFESYREKPDLAQDIKARAHTFVPNNLKENSSDALGLYNYSVLASLDAMQEWKSGQQGFIAYKNCNGTRIKVGFVLLEQKQVNDKPVVYIAQAGVNERGKGIGRALMECVLMHYPEGTNFLIGTRIFNKEAINLYQNCLKFESLNAQFVKEAMGLDERYCGFAHATSKEELALIRNKVSDNRASSENKVKLH